ncbi:MAG: CapA family protein [Parvibaculum sp.]
MTKPKFVVVVFALLLLALPARAGERVSVVLVGDTGFNGPGARVAAEGGFKRGKLVTVEEAVAKIAPWLEADIVFANLETVVTDRNEIAAREKMFVFRTHPDAVRGLMAAGINLFSLANNHAMDFGGEGAGETLRHVSGMGLLAWPGLGRDRDEAMAPHVFALGDMRVAASAVGNAGGGLPAREAQAGMLREQADFPAVAARLMAETADLRILSVHYGTEFAPLTEGATVARFRGVEAGGGVTIVAGHHQHVARGVEVSGGRVVFYGLGNFLHLGTQDMSRFDLCRDFGLLAKVGLVRGPEGLRVETVEAVPLTGMHVQPAPMGVEAGRLRVEVLNYLGARLGREGVRFRPQADGSGLWCAADASDARCAGWVAHSVSEREGEIAAACGKDVRRGKF